ncbi:MAG: hypothetical protein E6J90_53950 [Deltaproteobacteria bacterium]|nr:MAG: hypothetical protein E6J90_53950 [Deltaproteobacteria bacterium]
MTDRRDDSPFEVPVERLAGGRGQRRRALVAALSIALVVGGAIGLATVAGNARPGSSATGSSRRRVEELLAIPNREVAGAPNLTVVEQDGLDLRVRVWAPGAGLTTVRTVSGAVKSTDAAVFPVLAPTGDRILLFLLGGGATGSGGSNDRARLIDRAGKVLWTGTDLAAQSGAVWSRDGRMVIVAGNGRRWHLVSIGSDGAATDRVVRLPGEVFLPSPTPIGSISISRVDPRTVPLGYSDDGHWAYGGIVSPELGLLIGEFRVAVDGPKVERVLDLGVGRPDGLAPRPGTLGGRVVDPTTGRIANSRVNADTSGGAPSLEIRNPDSSFAFDVARAAPLGSAWGAHGGLYVLSADNFLFPAQAVLERIGPDAKAGPPIVTTISVTRPETAAQIILVDVTDPTRTSALELPGDASASIIAAELEP